MFLSLFCISTADKTQGRIDVRIEFKAIEHSQARDLFSNFHPGATTLAEEFADVVSKYKATPSQLQAYLLLHKDSPESAVRSIASWLADEKVSPKA